MKRLTCEMCGSTDLIKQDGVFVCQSCGCKYSVEEARKMMIEGTVEVQGTVIVDNSHLVSNYLDMAHSARDAGNNTEAENYCNKVIEIEPNNYKAWMLKGEAAAWQSTIQNSRVDEGVAAFVKGISFAPEAEKEELIEAAKAQIKQLSLAMISLRGDRFAKWPDEDECAGFLTDLASIMSTLLSFLQQTGANIPLSELMAPIATQINQSVIRAWKDVIWPDYNGDPNDSDDRANKYEWQRLIQRIGYCTTLVEKAIELCDDDDEEDITRYENLIFLHKAANDSCSWDYSITDWGSKQWRKDWSLTAEAKQARNTLIKGYEAKIETIKAKQRLIKSAELEERRKQYWAEHEDERKRLEEEKTSLTAQIKILEDEEMTIPGAGKIRALEDQIQDLKEQKKSLGLFKGKEKQALQERIDELMSQKNAAEMEYNAAKEEIQSRLEPLRNRVSEIEEMFDSPTDATNDSNSGKTSYDVVLIDIGDKKINVIKEVREITGLGLADAKELVERAPAVLKINVSKDLAEKYKKQLRAAGATVEIK